MIQCPKCGEENQIGSIFCRGCSEKLDLEKLRPDSFNREEKQNAVKTTITIIRNFLTLGIIAVIIGTIALVFLKPDLPANEVLSAEQENKTLRKFRNLRKGKPGSKHEFNVNEINMLATLVLELTEDAKIKAREKSLEAGTNEPIVPEGFYIRFSAPYQVELILESKIYDKVSVFATLKGNLHGSNRGLLYNIDKVSLGKVPLFMDALHQPVIDMYTQLMQRDPRFQREIQSQIEEIKVEGDKIILTKLKTRKK